MLLFGGAYLAGALLSTLVLAALFGAGTVAHLIGHFGFEGKPPVFFTRPISVFEAPAWLLSRRAWLRGADTAP